MKGVEVWCSGCSENDCFLDFMSYNLCLKIPLCLSEGEVLRLIGPSTPALHVFQFIPVSWGCQLIIYMVLNARYFNKFLIFK